MSSIIDNLQERATTLGQLVDEAKEIGAGSITCVFKDGDGIATHAVIVLNGEDTPAFLSAFEREQQRLKAKAEVADEKGS